MTPIRFNPIKIETLWGNEIWALSGLEGRETVVQNRQSAQGGQASQLTITELIRDHKEALLGRHVWQRYGERFPLLVKFITAEKQLSVQVHPDDAMARRKGLPNGKTEMWQVLEATPTASILLGFSTPDVDKKICSDGEALERVLRKYSVCQGDSYFIPAGTIHSIGAGVRILEIQQTSDTTYRLYDFNRIDKNGKKRALDLEDALEAIHFPSTKATESDASRPVDLHKNVFDASGSVVQLADCEHFTSTYISLSGGSGDQKLSSDQDHSTSIENPTNRNFSTNRNQGSYTIDLQAFDSFSIVVATAGEGVINYAQNWKPSQDQNQSRNQNQIPTPNQSRSIPIKKDDVILLPASLQTVEIQPLTSLQFVETHIK